jgi:aspartate racemase
MKMMLDMIGAGNLSELAGYMAGEVSKLAAAGADVGLLASNTPHIVFDEISRQSPLPLISIVDAACEAASQLGVNKIGLFGTRFTMQGRFYPDVFARKGITVIAPEPDEQEYIHDKYMGELVNGIFLPGTKAGLLAIADHLREREGIQGLILGGTELPLILGDVQDRGIPFLDTTRIHVERVLSFLMP